MGLVIEVARTIMEWFHYRDQNKYHNEIIKTLKNIEQLLQIKEELKVQGKDEQARQIQDYVNDRTEAKTIILDTYLESEAFWEDFKKYHCQS